MTTNPHGHFIVCCKRGDGTNRDTSISLHPLDVLALEQALPRTGHASIRQLIKAYAKKLKRKRREAWTKTIKRAIAEEHNVFFVSTYL